MKELNIRLEKIKNSIHTTMPEISNDVLDLLYEYFSCKLSYDIKQSMLCSDSNYSSEESFSSAN